MNPLCRSGRHDAASNGMAAMKKILLVDDETFFLQVLDRALRSPSTEVKMVETGKAALQEVATTPYHLCFLDICLPDLDGTEVLKSIAEMSPKTKVDQTTTSLLYFYLNQNQIKPVTLLLL